MSKEWKNGRVGELIASLESGISVNGEDGTPSNDDYAVLKVSAVTYGKFNPQASKKITGSELQRAKCNPKKGQIIISRSNTPDLVGASCYVSEDYPNRFLPDKLWQTVPHPEKKVEHKWLAYFLASPWARFRLSKLATGTSNSMKNITKSELLTLPVAIPPFLEQKKIASFLECWDNAIEKTEALITAKEKQFEWLMEKLFKPNDTCTPYRLGELFDNRKETHNTDLPLVSITREKGVIPHSETNRKDNSSEDKSKYLRIRPNDIGYNTMRMWQGVSALSGIDGIVSPAYTICIPKKIVDPEFMAFLFKTKPMIHKFYRYSQGLTSDTWNLKFHHFCEVKAEIPDIETQVEIAQILNTAKHEISLLKKTLEQYRNQKRGLMQKLLTGEWQVSCTQHGAESAIQGFSKENIV